MTWPAGVTLRTCTLGPDFGIVSGSDYGCDVVVSVSRPTMTWGATGSGGIGDTETLTFVPGQEVSFQLPVTDQAGWYIGGLPVDLSNGKQSHVYTLTIKPWIYNSLGRKTYSNATLTLSNLAIPTGDDPLDLDMSVATSGAQGGTVTLPDLLADLQASVDAYKAELEAVAAAPTDSFVADRISDPASETTAALNAAYAPAAAGLAPRSRVPQRADIAAVVTTFQHLHGFTIGNGDATSQVDYSTDPVIGAQCARLVTKGDGTFTTLGKVAMAQVNYTECNVRIGLRAFDLLHVSRFELYATSDSSFTNRYVWSFFYTAEVNSSVNFSKDGEAAFLDLSFADATVVGTPNRAALNGWQIRMADDNTGNKVTLDCISIAAVRKSTSYPRGVVSFAFDDGSQSQLDYAIYPLEEKGYRGTFFLIADALGTTQSGTTFFTLNAAKALDAKGHDIAPHAYHLANHNLADGFNSLSAADLATELRLVKDWCASNGFTRGADVFASPQGRFSPAMQAVVQRFFGAHRTTVSTSRETLPAADTMRLRTLDLPGVGGRSLAEVTAAIDQARAEGAWLILNGHKFTTGASGSSLECTTSDWQAILDHVAASGIEVATIAKVISNADTSPGRPAAIAASVYNSASQSVPNSVETVLSFDTEEFDSYNLYTAGSGASKITADRAGKWHFNATAVFTSNATGVRQIALAVNGVDVRWVSQNAVNGMVTRQMIGALLNLNKGDYVQIVAYQTSGGSLGVSGGANVSTFQAHYVGS